MSAKAIRPAGAHGQVAESTTGPVGERLRKLAGISPKPTSDIGHTPPFSSSPSSARPLYRAPTDALRLMIGSPRFPTMSAV